MTFLYFHTGHIYSWNFTFVSRFADFLNPPSPLFFSDCLHLVSFGPIGANKRAELWRLRDHSNRYVHKPRPVPEPRKQSLVGKHQASCSRDPSVTIQQREIFLPLAGVGGVLNPHTKRQWWCYLYGSVQ